ncbi:ATP-binding protein [Xylanimonas protaetiae]|uniref:ATP-binding protein n=1 Tax=Xylanimonas protaetiae TaxID=2509457 RepID=A0A4V0YG68_9MICO|nr:ATP-binding protein [Xylanimonas protaetiae]QAY70161.1 ATP-binding protein [Xylanimonas protaetiae]
MSRATAPRTRLPLRRPEADRWVGGVCAGLAAHLGLPVGAVRLVMALLALTGSGVAVYVFWWITIPTGDPRAAAEAAEPAALSRLAPRLRIEKVAARFQLRDIVIGAVLLAAAVFLVAVRSGWEWRQSWLLPALLSLGGLALAWSQLDAVQRGVEAGERRRWTTWARPAGGLVLVVAGALLLVGQDTRGWAVVQAASAALAVLVGFALVLAPWWLRLVRELGDERAARAREAERADIAAHLHDSVLQTLALIRSRAHDADSVARMARAQERELREWLYSERREAGTSLAAELRELVAQVEDGRVGKPAADSRGPRGTAEHGGDVAWDGGSVPAVAIDVVVVGDCVPTEATTALLQATREALVNAVAHGRPPVTVYLEVSDQAAEVFVRDRGDGFVMADIATDRFGVRESILGRVRRRGGTAEVTSRAGWGTEVRLRMPRVALPSVDSPARMGTVDSTAGAGTVAAPSPGTAPDETAPDETARPGDDGVVPTRFTTEGRRDGSPLTGARGDDGTDAVPDTLGDRP